MTIPLNSKAPTFKIGDLVLIHTGWGATTEKIGLVVETEGPGPYDYRVYYDEIPTYVRASPLTLLSEGKTGEV